MVRVKENLLFWTTFFVHLVCKLQVCKLEEESLSLNQVSPESNLLCLCPGDVVTYECTVIGGPRGSTVWKGSAFNDSCDDIILLHDRYNSPGVYYKSCLNETIVARGLPVEVNETYTSQLSVTLTTDLVGKSIECRHDDGLNETTVASIEISTEGIVLFPPGDLNVSGMAVCTSSGSDLVFQWSLFICDCLAVQYSITASNCGSCPANSTHNNITCTNAPTDGSTCTFSVQTLVRESIGSDPQQLNIQPSCTGTSENNETTTSLSTLILFVISLAVCGVFFILVLLIFCMLKKKPKLSSNKIHRSGKDATESESTYEDVGKVSTQMEMSKNVAYGCALKT